MIQLFAGIVLNLPILHHVMSIEMYDDLSFAFSEKITKTYSTSFYSASRLFSPEIRTAIYSIYGFVRLADEIVDTFHTIDQAALLDQFERDYDLAFLQGISANPVLHSFQLTVKRFHIPDEYIRSFIASMRADLHKKVYSTQPEADAYIYGSADVVGLMCLKVFCGDDVELFNRLVKPAMRLGSAFQKVNFLRDLKNDVELLGRIYFPDFSWEGFDEPAKERLVKEIERDFEEANVGIQALPDNSRVAVTVAYNYYLKLLHKIKETPAKELKSKRIRVSNVNKLWLLSEAVITHKLKMLTI